MEGKTNLSRQMMIHT